MACITSDCLPFDRHQAGQYIQLLACSRAGLVKYHAAFTKHCRKRYEVKEIVLVSNQWAVMLRKIWSGVETSWGMFCRVAGAPSNWGAQLPKAIGRSAGSHEC